MRRDEKGKSERARERGSRGGTQDFCRGNYFEFILNKNINNLIYIII
jgi:hypothetical protein